MKGEVAQRQRTYLVSQLQKHENGALKRLAQAVKDKSNNNDVVNYSRMHHRHNRS